MFNAKAESWLTKLEISCTRLNVDTINVLIDQTGSGVSLKASLKTFQPTPQWCSLFEGLPEEILEDEAPLLIELSLSRPMERQWLVELMAEFAPQGRILLLCSAWPFMYLSAHLKRCVNACWGEQTGILRFYDPRIFSVLVNQVLDSQQQLSLQSAVIFWSWQDRDGVDCVLYGEPASPDEVMKAGFEFTDDQIDKLITASDAISLTKNSEELQRYNLNKERLFTHCYNTLLEANALGLIVDTQRREYVIQSLKSLQIQE